MRRLSSSPAIGELSRPSTISHLSRSIDKDGSKESCGSGLSANERSQRVLATEQEIAMKGVAWTRRGLGSNHKQKAFCRNPDIKLLLRHIGMRTSRPCACYRSTHPALLSIALHDVQLGCTSGLTDRKYPGLGHHRLARQSAKPQVRF